MNVQEWLEQVKKLDELINTKLAERQRLIEIATDISPKMPDGMPFSNGGTVSQKMQNAVVNLIECEHEIDRLIDKYVDCKREVVKVLEKLPGKYYGVLHRYYIQGMTLEQVAEDMNYGVRQISRIKKESLQKLEDVIVCHA